VVSDVTCERVAGPFRLEELWRSHRPGDVVVLGTLGGLIELIRSTGTVCGYVRWRYVHRDAKALGRRGTANLRPDSTAMVLTRGPEA
jgi:hypothetical protein